MSTRTGGFVFFFFFPRKSLCFVEALIPCALEVYLILKLFAVEFCSIPILLHMIYSPSCKFHVRTLSRRMMLNERECDL